MIMRINANDALNIDIKNGKFFNNWVRIKQCSFQLFSYLVPILTHVFDKFEAHLDLTVEAFLGSSFSLRVRRYQSCIYLVHGVYVQFRLYIENGVCKQQRRRPVMVVLRLKLEHGIFYV